MPLSRCLVAAMLVITHSRVSTADSSPWDTDLLSIGPTRFGVLALRTVLTPAHADWAELRAALPPLRQANALLVDLRGNADKGAARADADRLSRLLIGRPGRGQADGTNFAGPIALLIDEPGTAGGALLLEAFRRHPRSRIFLSGPARQPQAPMAVPHDAFDAATAWLYEQAAARVSPPGQLVIDRQERELEHRRLRRLGLTVPPGGLLLERPFAEPFGRRSFVVPQRWLLQRTSQVVFAPALRADLPALQALMARAYGGWQVAVQRGWDWKRWFQSWDAKLAQAGQRWLRTREAFAPMAELQRFQLDNHTTIPLGLQFSATSVTARLHRPPSGPCTAVRNQQAEEPPLNPRDQATQPKQRPWFTGKDLASAYYISGPANRGELAAVRCGAQWIGLTTVRPLIGEARTKSVLALSRTSSDRPALRHVSPEVAYLRLPEFSKPNAETIERERQHWEKPTGRERLLMVDVRGNQGGDVALEPLAGWVDAAALEAASTQNTRRTASCLYHALRWGYGSFSSAELKPPLTSVMKKDLQSAVDRLFESDPDDCQPRFETATAARTYRDRPPRSRPRPGRPLLMVIVDNECGSDCEYMVSTLAKLPETVVVGVNSGGVVQYIQPGYAVLPNTRLPFRIALGTSDIYGDGRSVDGYGLDVDVLIEGDDAWSGPGLLRLADLLIRGRE